MLNVTTIPLNRLVPSAANVRRTDQSVRVEELAASIAAHGLLQNLTAQAVEAAKRKRGSAAHYEVIAGGRRLAALKLLAKRKAIAADAPIPCHVLTGGNATEISLAENALQAPMHPTDQFEAFHALHRDGGLSAEDIAARFGVTPAVVKQRLKLAAVSSALIDAYRKGEMNLDQLTAFAITDDHERQERVWAGCGYDDSRDALLAALTDDHVPADDRGAQFVGVAAYTAAGGAVLRDLFDTEGEGFLTDPDLLDNLVAAKLQSIADAVQAEGWKWVTTARTFDYAAAAAMRRVYAQTVPLSDADQARLDALEDEYAALELDETEESDGERARLDRDIAALAEQEQFDAAAMAIAGAIVTLTPSGEPRIERGFIRKEDEPQTAVAPKPAAPGGAAPLSAKLAAELTACRTLALQDVLGQQPEAALLAVSHGLAAAIFYPHHRRISCLEIGAHRPCLEAHWPGIGDHPAMQRIAERHAAWAARLPDDPAQLWGWLGALDGDERLRAPNRTV